MPSTQIHQKIEDWVEGGCKRRVKVPPVHIRFCPSAPIRTPRGNAPTIPHVHPQQPTSPPRPASALTKHKASKPKLKERKAMAKTPSVSRQRVSSAKHTKGKDFDKAVKECVGDCPGICIWYPSSD